MKNDTLVEMFDQLKEEIENTGVLVFYSDYGKHQVTIKIGGDSDIYEVSEALRAFLLATGFSANNVDEILLKP